MSHSPSVPTQAHTLDSLISQMANKLAHTIAMLESDQVIEQMRNDDSLY